MAELITLARPYAKAAFKYALGQSSVGQWSDKLALYAAIVSDKGAADFISRPELTGSQKAQFVSDASGNTEDQFGDQFLKLLAENNRLPLLPNICELFYAYQAEQEKQQPVSVVSAFPVSDEQVKKIEVLIQSKLGKTAQVTTQVDKDLIGGMIINAGNFVIDNSVRGKISRLADNLNY